MLLEIKNLITAECKSQDIDPLVIMAIVDVESGGNPKVARYERQYSYLWKDLEFSKIQKITQETERQFQKTSWGLGQIMGASARWLGYSAWLPDLCDPKVNLFWMCKFYKKVCSKQVYLNDGVSCYNAGSVKRKEDGTYQNEQYVQKVLAAMNVFQSEQLKTSTLQ